MRFQDALQMNSSTTPARTEAFNNPLGFKFAPAFTGGAEKPLVEELAGEAQSAPLHSVDGAADCDSSGVTEHDGPLQVAEAAEDDVSISVHSSPLHVGGVD